MKTQITVKQQNESDSKKWGVYVNGVLREGGFIYKDSAIDCAEELKKEMDFNKNK